MTSTVHKGMFKSMLGSEFQRRAEYIRYVQVYARE